MFFKIKLIKGGKYLYLVENARVNGKVRPSTQIYVGTVKQVYDMVMNSKKGTKLVSYSYGKGAALLGAAEKIDLINVVNQHVKRRNQKGLTPGEYLFLLIVGRAENALSRNQMGEWFRKSGMKFIFQPKHQLSSQNCLNYMKKFDREVIRKIELDIAKNLMRNGHSPTRLLFDTTNQFTYITKGESIPKIGNSKQKRYDKNLIGIGLVTTDLNLPLMSETYPGNKSDEKVFVEIFDNLCKRLEILKVNISELVMIFDRGINSTSNITQVIDKMHLVGGLKRNQVSEFMRISIDHYDLLYENRKGHKIFGIKCGKKNVFGEEFTVILTYNEHTCKRQKARYELKKMKIMEEVEEIRKKANRKGSGRKLTKKGIYTRLVRLIPVNYSTIFDYDVSKKNGYMEIQFDVKTEKEQEFYNSFGKSAIFTDMHEWTDVNIAKTYHSRHEIEEDFKWINDRIVIPVTPVNVRKDLTIRVHVFICIMGLLLYRIIQKELNMNMSLQKLAKTLEEIRIAIVKNGRRKASLVIEEMDPKVARIFSKLDLGRFLP